MKETGLMFKAPLVRAILSGQKTQTRRVMKLNFNDRFSYMKTNLRAAYNEIIEFREQEGTWFGFHDWNELCSSICPFGKPGDRIYVRETWNWFDPQEIPADRVGQRAPFTGCQGKREIPWVSAYAADGPLQHLKYGANALWRPSIHMPKWAARIWLEVTGVRVERLQDISNEDAIAEGVNRISHGREGYYYSAIRDEQHSKNWNYPDDAFRELWDSTTGRPALPANKNSKRYARVKYWLDTHPDTTGWDANPWVWVINFKTISTTGRPA